MHVAHTSISSSCLLAVLFLSRSWYKCNFLGEIRQLALFHMQYMFDIFVNALGKAYCVDHHCPFAKKQIPKKPNFSQKSSFWSLIFANGHVVSAIHVLSSSLSPIHSFLGSFYYTAARESACSSSSSSSSRGRLPSATAAAAVAN
jgi:hypothetical protein